MQRSAAIALPAGLFRDKKTPQRIPTILWGGTYPAVPLKLCFTHLLSGANTPYALTQHTRETPTTLTQPAAAGFGSPARKG